MKISFNKWLYVRIRVVYSRQTCSGKIKIELNNGKCLASDFDKVNLKIDTVRISYVEKPAVKYF